MYFSALYGFALLIINYGNETRKRDVIFWRIDCKMIRQLLEFLELDLIKAINETTMTTKSDGSNQHLLEADLEAVAPQREEEGDE